MTLKCSTSTVQADGEEWFSPSDLSSNGTLGGDTFAVYASNNWDASLFPAWKMFDGDGSTCWYNASTPTDLIFYNPEPIRLEMMEFTNREDAPNYTFTAGTVYGSNDNVTYTLIGTFTNNATGAGDSYYVLEEGGLTSPDFYKYYKVSLTGATNNGTGMSNVNMYGYKAKNKTVYNPLRYTTTTPTYSSNFQGTGSVDSSNGYTTAGNSTLSAFGSNGTLASNYGLDKKFYIQVKFKVSQWAPYYNTSSVQFFNLYNRSGNFYPIQFGNGQGNIFAFKYTRQGTNCTVSYPTVDTWYIFKVWCDDDLGEIINFGIYDENDNELSSDSLVSTSGQFQNSEPYFLDIYGFTNSTQNRNYQGYVTYDGYNTYIAKAKDTLAKWRMANKSQTIEIKMSNSNYSPSPTPTPTPTETTVTNMSSNGDFGNIRQNMTTLADSYLVTTDTGWSWTPPELGQYSPKIQWLYLGEDLEQDGINLTGFGFDKTGTQQDWIITTTAYYGYNTVDISNISAENPVRVDRIAVNFTTSNGYSVPTMPISIKNMYLKYIPDSQ